MNKRGFTLLEVMFALTILTIVTGTLFTISMSMGRSARLQQANVTTQLEVRRGLQRIIRDLRQAASFTMSSLPSDTLTYSVATDIDGNGYAVDVSGNIETSPPRTIQRDVNDLNGDGVLGDQLVLLDTATGQIDVLANNLRPDEDTDNDGVLDPSEDVDGNGVLDRGIWFETWGGGMRVTIATEVITQDQYPARCSVQEIIIPRN